MLIKSQNQPLFDKTANFFNPREKKFTLKPIDTNKRQSSMIQSIQCQNSKPFFEVKRTSLQKSSNPSTSDTNYQNRINSKPRSAEEVQNTEIQKKNGIRPRQLINQNQLNHQLVDYKEISFGQKFFDNAPEEQQLPQKRRVILRQFSQQGMRNTQQLSPTQKNNQLPDVFLSSVKKIRSNSKSEKLKRGSMIGFRIQSSQQKTRNNFEQVEEAQMLQTYTCFKKNNQLEKNKEVEFENEFIQAANTPNIKLPKLESTTTQPILKTSKNYLQSKAQNKIIKRIFSGKTET